MTPSSLKASFRSPMATAVALCTPSLIYLVLGVLSLLMIAFKKFSAITLVVQAVFILSWTWVLNYLCSKGYSSVSWFFVLLPYVILLFSIVFAAGSLDALKAAH